MFIAQRVYSSTGLARLLPAMFRRRRREGETDGIQSSGERDDGAGGASRRANVASDGGDHSDSARPGLVPAAVGHSGHYRGAESKRPRPGARFLERRPARRLRSRNHARDAEPPSESVCQIRGSSEHAGHPQALDYNLTANEIPVASKQLGGQRIIAYHAHSPSALSNSARCSSSRKAEGGGARLVSPAPVAARSRDGDQ